MPSVGPTEVLLVLVIALLVLGPHRLPELARQLGRGIRQFREAARNITKEMGAEDLVEDLKGLNEARGTFGQTVRKELGLDELGPLPSLDDIGKDKPASAAQTAAVAADVLVANATVEATAAAAQAVPAATDAAAVTADVLVANATVEATPDLTPPTADVPAPRKRTPRATGAGTPADEAKAAPKPRKRTAKAAAVPTPTDEASAVPAPRKRTPRATPVAAPDADQAPAAAGPATPRPARKRTAKTQPGEPA
jgi:TatA/E family protein of Tat protein translocase